MNPPLLPDEAERLAVLQSLGLLDTPPEARFDRLTRLAHALFDVPIALVTLVDAERIWLKSRQGVEIAEVPRAHSLCEAVIAGRAPLVVEDAAADPRFAASPLVVGEPHVRFYAGCPLRVGAHGVGVFCLIDRRPRRLSERELSLLADLAALAQDEIDGLTLAQALATREAAEAALVASNARKQAVLESALDAIITIDARNRVVEFNQAAERIFGYTRAQALGEDLAELLIPPRSRAGHRRGLRHYLQTGEAHTLRVHMEITAMRASGEIFPVEMAVCPIEIAGQEPLFTATMRDLSGRREAEHALRASERQYRLVVDNLKEVIFQTGPGGEWRFLNPAWTEVTGFSVAESLGVSFLDFVHPDDREANLARFGPLIAREKPYCRHEVRYLTADGGFRWVEVFARLMLDEQGEMMGTSGTLNDITERKLFEHQLREAQARAEAASRAKSDFLAMVSHEMRTPLNALVGMADLLWDTPLDPEQRGYARVLRGAGDTLAALIDGILDLSKVEAGHLELELRPFDLADLVSETVELMGVRAREKGLTLGWTLEPGTATVLSGDALRVRQVLLNVLGNAVKFTERGGIHVDVGAGATGFVRVAVTDTGVGIPREAQAAIFESFTQADSSITRRFGGTGLGLAISRRLVERMGGAMGVVSAVGAGSTFTFTLPSLPPEQAAPTRRAEGPGAEAAPGQGRSLRILLVDDAEDNRVLIRSYLKRTAHTLDEAEDGERGVERFREGAYDLVLMDIQMPGLDGHAATRLIRAWEADHGRSPTPVLALSANALGEDVARTRQAGCDGHLTKPIRKEAFLRMLAEQAELSGREGGDAWA